MYVGSSDFGFLVDCTIARLEKKRSFVLHQTNVPGRDAKLTALASIPSCFSLSSNLLFFSAFELLFGANANRLIAPISKVLDRYRCQHHVTC